MALMHTTKRKRRKRRSGVPHQYLTNLPRALLEEVLSHVASSSITNLFNAKRACKSMFEASSQRCVLEHAAVLEKFPYINRHNRRSSSSFLQECMESGNREALFCTGMAEYFSTPETTESGLRRLRAAAAKGHAEARYVCGMILLCFAGGEDDDARKEGLGFLEGLRRSDTVRKCRKTVESVMEHLWWVNGDGRGLAGRCWMGKDVRRGSCRCVEKEELKCLSRNPDFLWLRREEQVLEIVESRLCDLCFWDNEVPVFCNKLGPLNVFLL
ncbi:unnamed protein product [Linum trigynum]